MPRAVGRSLDILWALVHSQHPQTAAEVAAACGLNRASSYRLLESLLDEGWIVGEGQPRRYAASMRVAEMGAALLVHDRTRQVVLPYMLELAQAVQVRVLLNFYERGSVIITDVAELLGDRVLPTLTSSRVDAACTACGKILLAHQPREEIERVCLKGLPDYTPFTKTSPEEIAEEIERSRERGYGTVDRELNPEFCSLGAPVFDDRNQAVAALGMSIPGSLTDEVVARLLSPALHVARRASIALGHRPKTVVLAS
jgi:DNA-binding IclR family transcriptional regulator